jgi:uncharacterized delta-60 repeat protein
MTGSALVFAGCASEDPAPTSGTASPVALNSEILPISLSATEADRFQTVIATTGNQYYAAGFVTVSEDAHMAVARFGTTGGLDASFGQGGIATVNVAVGAGKKAEFARGAVVRFNPTGQLDPTFGTNGIVRLDLSTGTVSGTAFRGDTSWGLTLLPGDNLLVVGGEKADGAGRTDIDYAIVKLTAGGSRDTTFGTNGIFTLDVGTGNDSPRTAILQPDGKIVVSGHTSDAGVVTTVLFRLLPTGQLDPSFGVNGIVNAAILAFVAEAYDVALQGQNLVIAGYGRDASTGTVDIISARFLPNGTWDKTYGDNGVDIIDVAGQDDRSRKLGVLPDGHVLIVGQGKPTATTQDAALVLLTPNGQRETRLNGNGVALIDFGGSTDALFGLALSPDKTRGVAVGWKGVDAGAVSPTNNDDSRVVRFSIPSF